MAGTACNAALSAVSDRAASALMPARSNSLFFTGWPNLAARCLSSSTTRYSALGMVKLSRTSLGFLTFSTFAAAALGAAFTTALAAAWGAGLAGATGTFFAGFGAALASALATALAAGLVVSSVLVRAVVMKNPFK